MRTLRQTLLRGARALGVFRISRSLTADGIRILCYHGTWLGDDDRFQGDAMFIQAQTFRDRLAVLRRLGYPVISLSDAVEGLNGKRTLPKNAVVITIDDCWFSTYAVMLPELRKHGMPATLYCNTAELIRGRPVYNVMAYYVHLLAGFPALNGEVRDAYDTARNVALTPDERWQGIQDLGRLLKVDIGPLLGRRVFDVMTKDEFREFFSNENIDVQLHTHNHTLHDMSAPFVSSEIDENRAALSALLGVSPSHFRHFCYPSGVSSLAAAEALDEIGISSSTLCEPGLAFAQTPRQLLPRFLDGDNYTPIEFEAEMSGAYHLVRTAISRVKGLRSALMNVMARLPKRSEGTAH